VGHPPWSGRSPIEQGTGMTRELAESMAERGIAWVPTLLTGAELREFSTQLSPAGAA
jgi:hypothetical protein